MAPLSLGLAREGGGRGGRDGGMLLRGRREEEVERVVMGSGDVSGYMEGPGGAEGVWSVMKMDVEELVEDGECGWKGVEEEAWEGEMKGWSKGKESDGERRRYKTGYEWKG